MFALCPWKEQKIPVGHDVPGLLPHSTHEHELGLPASFRAAEGLNALTNATYLSSMPVCLTYLILHKMDSDTGCC